MLMFPIGFEEGILKGMYAVCFLLFTSFVPPCPRPAFGQLYSPKGRFTTPRATLQPNVYQCSQQRQLYNQYNKIIEGGRDATLNFNSVALNAAEMLSKASWL